MPRRENGHIIYGLNEISFESRQYASSPEHIYYISHAEGNSIDIDWPENFKDEIPYNMRFFICIAKYEESNTGGGGFDCIHEVNYPPSKNKNTSSNIIGILISIDGSQPIIGNYFDSICVVKGSKENKQRYSFNDLIRLAKKHKDSEYVLEGENEDGKPEYSMLSQEESQRTITIGNLIIGDIIMSDKKEEQKEMKTEKKYLKYEPRKVMSENDFRMKTLLIERIRVGAQNDLYTKEMYEQNEEQACTYCDSPVGEYHEDRCTMEICPRCGETRSVCKCTDEYAVSAMGIEDTDIDTEDEKTNTASNDEIVLKVEQRMNDVEKKLNEIITHLTTQTKSPQPYYPRIGRKLQDPPFISNPRT